MSTTTHSPNITVNVYLDPSPAPEAGFGILLLLVPLSANSLDGDRVMEFTSYEDAQTAQTAGFISTTTLAAAEAVFSQRPKPENFKVGYVDLVTSVAAVKAFKDFGAVGTGAFDTVIEAHTAGEDGDNYTVELVGDSVGAVSITISGYAVTIHVQPGVSTVTNVETAIAALAGANDVIDVKTGGTGATVLAVADCNMAATHLAGGVDAVTVETYATGLAACIAYDEDFYGVCITPRTDAEIVLVSDYIESASKKMLFGFQSDDASWLNSGVPAGLSTIMGASGNERTIAHYHTTDAEWMDVACMANRLRFDPDNVSAPWHGYQARGVDAYSTAPTAAERLLAIANDANLGLPYGGSDFVIDPGVNATGRAVDEILSADWFATRIQERTAALVVEHGERGEKIVVDKSGQKKILALIEGLLAQGVAAGHFVAGQTEAVAETISASDLTNRRLRFTVRAQLAVSGRIFTFDLYFSRNPIADDE